MVKSLKEASVCLPFIGPLLSENVEETKVILWSEAQKYTILTLRKISHFEEKHLGMILSELLRLLLIPHQCHRIMKLEKWRSSVRNRWWWLVNFVKIKQLCKLISLTLFNDFLKKLKNWLLKHATISRWCDFSCVFEKHSKIIDCLCTKIQSIYSPN